MDKLGEVLIEGKSVADVLDPSAYVKGALIDAVLRQT